jgi:hypothetical protein
LCTIASIASDVYSVHIVKINWKRIVGGVCISLLAYGAIVGGLIAFGTAKPPDVARAITKPFADIDTHALPELLRYKTRDGALLSYREYRASGRQVAILLHDRPVVVWICIPWRWRFSVWESLRSCRICAGMAQTVLMATSLM